MRPVVANVRCAVDMADNESGQESVGQISFFGTKLKESFDTEASK
jgi:hypothetical protein